MQGLRKRGDKRKVAHVSPRHIGETLVGSEVTGDVQRWRDGLLAIPWLRRSVHISCDLAHTGRYLGDCPYSTARCRCRPSGQRGHRWCVPQRHIEAPQCTPEEASTTALCRWRSCKTLNREQEEVLQSKSVVVALIIELERLHTPVAAAVAEELATALRPPLPLLVPPTQIHLSRLPRAHILLLPLLREVKGEFVTIMHNNDELQPANENPDIKEDGQRSPTKS